MSSDTVDDTFAESMEAMRHGESRRRRRRVLLIAAASIGSVVLYWLIDPLGFSDNVSRYWPIVLLVPAGWILGGHFARITVNPSRRFVVCLDPEDHSFRMVSIPEEVFPMFDQTGNSVVYRSQGGLPVYLARDIDTESGTIDYGWVHENDALLVMSREQAYARWRDLLDSVLFENLTLMEHPRTMALEHTRSTLRRHLDEISVALGLDIGDTDAEPFPEPSPLQTPPEVSS